MFRFQNPLSQSIIFRKECDGNYVKRKHQYGLRQKSKILKYKYLRSF